MGEYGRLKLFTLISSAGRAFRAPVTFFASRFFWCGFFGFVFNVRPVGAARRGRGSAAIRVKIRSLAHGIEIIFKKKQKNNIGTKRGGKKSYQLDEKDYKAFEMNKTTTHKTTNNNKQTSFLLLLHRISFHSTVGAKSRKVFLMFFPTHNTEFR